MFAWLKIILPILTWWTVYPAIRLYVIIMIIPFSFLRIQRGMRHVLVIIRRSFVLVISRQHRLKRHCNRRNSMNRRPPISKQVKTDVAISINMRVDRYTVHWYSACATRRSGGTDLRLDWFVQGLVYQNPRCRIHKLDPGHLNRVHWRKPEPEPVCFAMV